MMTRLTPEDVVHLLTPDVRLLIATDFDGTLCRIARTPDLVFLPERTRDLLARLSRVPGVAVAVLSGRTLEDVTARIGLPIVYAGNHGFEIRGQDFHFEHPAALELAPRLAETCDCLERALKRWHGTWVERKRLTATVHFRNVAPDQQHRVQMETRRVVSECGTAFALRSGKRAIEVRPRIDWHKGAALDYIRGQIGMLDALCLCAGDDVTDESMFQSNPEATTVRVGWHGGSSARFYVDSPEELTNVLELIGSRNEAPALTAS